MVSTDNPEKLEARYGNLLPVLVKAIQKQQKFIEAMQAQNEKQLKINEAMQEQNEKQQNEIAKLKKLVAASGESAKK